MSKEHTFLGITLRHWFDVLGLLVGAYVLYVLWQKWQVANAAYTQEVAAMGAKIADQQAATTLATLRSQEQAAVAATPSGDNGSVWQTAPRPHYGGHQWTPLERDYSA